MAPFSRTSFADEPVRDLHERVLRSVCKRGGNRAGARVNAQPVAGELGIEMNDLFRTVLSLVDYGFLAYLGAGPVVEITQLGARRCADEPSGSDG
jgi:hypothetical protein